MDADEAVGSVLRGLHAEKTVKRIPKADVAVSTYPESLVVVASVAVFQFFVIFRLLSSRERNPLSCSSNADPPYFCPHIIPLPSAPHPPVPKSPTATRKPDPTT